MSYRSFQPNRRQIRSYGRWLLLSIGLTLTKPSRAEVTPSELVKITLVNRAAELQGLLEEWSPAFEIATSESVNAGDILGPTVLTGKLRIWVVVGSTSHARLYFAAPEGERFLRPRRSAHGRARRNRTGNTRPNHCRYRKRV